MKKFQNHVDSSAWPTVLADLTSVTPTCEVYLLRWAKMCCNQLEHETFDPRDNQRLCQDHMLCTSFGFLGNACAWCTVKTPEGLQGICLQKEFSLNFGRTTLATPGKRYHAQRASVHCFLFLDKVNLLSQRMQFNIRKLHPRHHEGWEGAHQDLGNTTQALHRPASPYLTWRCSPMCPHNNGQIVMAPDLSPLSPPTFPLFLGSPPPCVYECVCLLSLPIYLGNW